MAKCGNCGKDVARQRFLQESLKWVGVDCGCVRALAIANLANPWSDLTLQHIHDEQGKPIRVTSIHQLREAEKRYEFKHHLANSNSEHFNIPPTHKPQTVLDRYERKFRGHA
jgi:hypothetical protein